MAEFLIKFLFWLFIFAIIYIYIGYFLILLIGEKLQRMSGRDGSKFPNFTNTLFIPAYNEETVIAEKIENSLHLKYQGDLPEIVVASDGSTDRTNNILNSYRKTPRLRVFINDKNEGKNDLINKFIPLTSGQIIIFTDANSIFTEDSIINILRHFCNPAVGCVGGHLKYLKGKSATAKGEGLYFKYENQIRKLEGRQGKMVGANGAIYAIRRELFVPVPPHAPNDFYHPLAILKQGYDSVFEENAVAYEKATEDQSEEFKRRSRIVARSIAALVEVNKKFGVFKGKGWFNIFSHKVLRWLTFPMLVVIWFLNLFLIADPLYLMIFHFQNIFYIFGTIGFFFEKAGIKMKPFYVPYYFLLINLAAFVGLIQWLSGQKISTWQKASTTR